MTPGTPRPDLDHGMGEPIARFRSNPLHVALYFACGAVPLGLGSLALVLFLRSLSAGDRVDITLPALAFRLVAAGAALVARGWRLPGGVVVCEEGLVRLGGQDGAMRWEDVAAVRRGVPAGDGRLTITAAKRLSIRDRGGREWVFTEALSDFRRLRELVEERTLAPLLVAAVRELEACGELTFGDIGLSYRGLTFPGKGPLPWEQVRAALVWEGEVVVLAAPAGEVHAAPLPSVPNSHVLLVLVETFRARAAG